MARGGTVLTVVLLLVGGAALAVAVIDGQHVRSVQLAVGMALVLVGYLLRAADTLGWLPDVLMRGVDDEDAVATLLGLTATLLGGLLLLRPFVGSAEPRTVWSLAIFGLLVSVLVAVHVVSTFSIED